ncbi:MAG: phospholipase D-like domain-containing protein, partial [Elusimicrobiota bacterium]
VPGLSAAGQDAYQSLLSQVETVAAPAPTPVARAVEAPRVNTGDPDAVAALSEAQMYAASDKQRLEMLRTLIKHSRPKQNIDADADYRQERVEEAISRLLGSAPDAASFDRMFYNVDHAALFGSVSYTRNIMKMAARQLTSTVPGDWAGLARYVDTVADTRSSGRNTVQFLIDGGGAIAPVLAAIDTAKKSVHISVFQFQADEVGWNLTRILADRARKGVKVRVLLDEHGSAVKKDPEALKLLAFMSANGIEVRVQKAPLLLGHLDHRKVMVVDGDIGFTGGMNIGKLYQVDWHDQQTLIMGPAVAALQDAFLEKWKANGGETGSEEDLYPPLREVENGAETRVVMHRGGQ